MKLRFLFTVLLMSILSVHAQWYSIPSPYYGNLLCVKFVNQNTGFIGANTEILKTTNGGASWTSNAAISDFMINDISFPSTAAGYYAANIGAIAKTTNLGTSWLHLNPNASTSSILSLSFPSETVGYAVGGGGIIRKTIDGGTTWSAQTSSLTSEIDEVHFSDLNNGVACGVSGKIIRTTNGGNTWTNIYSGTSNSLLNMCFVGSNIGFIVGASGTILKTTDGGLTWLLQTSGTTKWLSAVCFKNANEGYAGGASGTILKTINGGTTWQTVITGLTVQGINDIAYVNNRYIAVTDGGSIITDVLISDINQNSVIKTTVKLFPNPFHSELSLQLNSEKPINNASLTMYDGIGREVINTKGICSKETIIDCKSLVKGIYIYKIIEDDGVISSGKLIAE